MEPPPQLANGAAAPVELQPPSIDGVSDEMESVVPSVQVLATDLTSEIDRSPDQNKSPGEIETVVSSAQDSATELTSEVKQSPESKKSSAEMSNSVEKEKSTTVVMSAAIGKYSQMQNCTDKSNGETESSMIKQSLENGSKIEQSPDNNVPSAQIENSAETKKASAEKFGRELSLRLDPSGAVTLMLLASPVYAVLAVLPLWLFADQPQAFLWTFAHLTCLYLFLWIITVSTESVSTVFVRVTYVLMLAFTVVHLIGPMNGMLFLYSGMVYLAGTLGYAVAEHFQRAGFEKTANALCSSPSNSKKYEEKVAMMHAVTVLMSLPILARMACLFLVPYSGHMSQMDVLHLMIELTAEMFAVAVLWIIYITEYILRGALVSMERFLWNAFTSCIACYLLVILLSFKFAEAVGMLVMWLEWMAIGGFFGYCLAVRAFYCKMLARINTTAANEQNGVTC